MLKKALAFILIFTFSVSAQIGGLSATKINAYSATVVPLNKMEFEPSISVNFSKDIVKQNKFNGTLANKEYKMLEVSSSFYFRFTYGLTEKIEVGFSIPSNVEAINFGLKYKLSDGIGKNTSLALLGGLNVPLGNNSYYLTDANFSEKLFNTGIAYGLVISQILTRKSSVDFNFIAQSHVPANSNSKFNKFDFSVNADYGYYLTDNLQAILGVSYFKVTFNNSTLNQTSLICIPGISVEKGKNYSFSLSIPFNVYSHNIKSFIGFGFVLTILLE